MKKNILIKLIILSFIAVLICGSVSVIILQKNYENNTQNNILTLIKATSETLDKTKSKDDIAKIIASQTSNNRITIISPEGTVLGDSNADITAIENHNNRPEIKEAVNNGAGFSKRFSDTQNARMLYVAYRCSDNNIYRVAVPISGIDKSIADILPAVLSGLILSIIVSFFLASKFSKSAIAPLENITKGISNIEQGNYNDLLPTTEYEELIPLTSSVNSLAKTIQEKIGLEHTQQQKLEFLLNSITQSIIVVDHNTNILSCNNPAKMLFNSGDIQIGKSLLYLTHNPKIVDAVEKCLKDENSSIFDMDVQNIERIYTISISPISNMWVDKGAIIILTDNTDSKNAEALRREFFANVSHELKTPITSIAGFAELLHSGIVTDPDKQKDYLDRIMSESYRMTSLINDILNLSSLEDSKTAVTLTNLDVFDEANKTISFLQPQITSKGVSVNLTGEPCNFYGNQSHMRQLFVNLIENAIKYNKQNGKVNVSIKKEATALTITVTDTGVGIPAKDIPRLFERFYRADKGRSSQTSGTGLGLAIVKHIVSKYHGDITITSQLDVGTTIIVKLIG